MKIKIHGERQALLVNIGRILIIEHIIERRDVPVSVGDLGAS